MNQKGKQAKPTTLAVVFSALLDGPPRPRDTKTLVDRHKSTGGKRKDAVVMIKSLGEQFPALISSSCRGP